MLGLGSFSRKQKSSNQNNNHGSSNVNDIENQDCRIEVQQPSVSASSFSAGPPPPPEPSSISGFDATSGEDADIVINPEPEYSEDEPVRPPIPNVCMSLASAGLMFGATAAAATGNRNSEAQDHLDVWTTRLSAGRRRGGFDFSTSQSALASLLGEEKYRRVSQMTGYARTVSPSERCFFLLLLLVTMIYALGILTALVLLCFHMWLFK